MLKLKDVKPTEAKITKIQMKVKFNKLIQEREKIKSQEKVLTKKIKELRQKIWNSDHKIGQNIQQSPFVMKLKQEFRALRISATDALKKTGYNNREISKILNISYERLRQIKICLILESERDAFKQSHAEYHKYYPHEGEIK